MYPASVFPRFLARLEQEKHSPYTAKYAVLDLTLLSWLMGKTRNSEKLNKVKDDIRTEAKSAKDVRLLHQIHMVCIIVTFYSSYYSFRCRPH